MGFPPDGWLDEVAQVAATLEADPGVDVVVRQVVERPDGRHVHRVVVSAGRVGVLAGDGEATVTLTTDEETAARVAGGEVAPDGALGAGLVRVGGDLRALVAVQPVLTVLAERLAAARAQTSNVPPDRQ